MKGFFNELFQYNNEMNQQLIRMYNNNRDKMSDRAIKLISHILNAHHIWNCRIIKKEITYGVMLIQPLDQLDKIDLDNYGTTLSILRRFSLTTAISYTNTQGKTFENSVRDILYHIINHSTYHRAQIASDFKEAGIEPLISDYIFYKR